MIMNHKTSTSLSEIENDFDLLMSDQTGYKSLDMVDTQKGWQKQKRNPQTHQVKQSIRVSIDFDEEDAMKQSTTKSTQQEPETSSFIKQNYEEKQTSSSNKFRKSVGNAIFLDNFQTLFKKKPIAAFSDNENISSPKKIKSKKKLHVNNQQSQSYQKERQQKIMKELPQQQDQMIQQQQKQSQQIAIKQKLMQRSILLERLKNIHIFYKIKIDEEATKRKNNDSLFVQMLQQNEIIHLHKVQSMQNLMIRQKRDSNMNEKQIQIRAIQANTQFYIKEKEKHLQKNIQLKKQLQTKLQKISQKQQYLDHVIQQKKKYRQQVQTNEKSEIKFKKWRKQLTSFMAKGHQQIEKLKRYYDRQDQYMDGKRSF